jgi:5-methylcytosine-specific restriction endonuclease McrA
LWGRDDDKFPKPWVSSAELLELTGQKYFDRRTRELRDHLGCDIVSSYKEEFSGHAWRIVSPTLTPPLDREYLTASQKKKLFEAYNYCCSVCGAKIEPGVRGLQADHKIPLSREGDNGPSNWQPLCNTCNVGKRRACDNCELDCLSCSWAFPELVGIKTLIDIKESTLRKVEAFGKAKQQTKDQVFEDAAEFYIDHQQVDFD